MALSLPLRRLWNGERAFGGFSDYAVSSAILTGADWRKPGKNEVRD